MIRLSKKSLLATSIALLASHTAALAQEVTWRFSNWLPQQHAVVTKMVEPWARDVEAATEGRVKIQILPALGAPAAHYELVRNGVADIAFGVHSYSPERFKLTEIVEVPFTAENALVNSIAYWRTYNQFFLDKNEHEGTKLLGLWVPGSYQLFTNNKVDDLEDLDGIKIRIPGVLVERLANALGMVTISSPLTEAYDQVSRGIIDGMFQNYVTVIDFNMTQHMPQLFTLPGGFSASSQFLVVNENSWNSISPEDQAAIEKLSGEAMVRRFAAVWQEDNSAAFAKLAEAGVTVHPIEGDVLENIRSKISFLEEEWVEEASAKGADAKGAMTFFREEIDRVASELGVPKD